MCTLYFTSWSNLKGRFPSSNCCVHLNKIVILCTDAFHNCYTATVLYITVLMFSSYLKSWSKAILQLADNATATSVAKIGLCMKRRIRCHIIQVIQHNFTTLSIIFPGHLHTTTQSCPSNRSSPLH